MTPTAEPGDPSRAAGRGDDCSTGPSISERITATTREKSTAEGRRKRGRGGQSREERRKGVRIGSRDRNRNRGGQGGGQDGGMRMDLKARKGDGGRKGGGHLEWWMGRRRMDERKGKILMKRWEGGWGQMKCRRWRSDGGNKSKNKTRGDKKRRDNGEGRDKMR